MKKILTVITLILLVLLTGCKNNEKIKELRNEKKSATNQLEQEKTNERPNFSTGIIEIKTQDNRKIELEVEIAKNDQERAYGLMFVDSLAENKGMWFPFENTNIQNFWMKNTLIPLDIIFIDQDYKIINIEQAKPCRSEDCVIYSSKIPAKYVLEVNQGYTDKNKITVGDLVYLIIGEE